MRGRGLTFKCVKFEKGLLNDGICAICSFPSTLMKKQCCQVEDMKNGLLSFNLRDELASLAGPLWGRLQRNSQIKPVMFFSALG
jgi:hypothetical protein